MKYFNKSRIIFLIAVLMLCSLYLFPIWSITLHAPQYPDGISMNIWINKVDGSTEGTLQNVNILNHYIGMKPIHPDSIKELDYFPFIILFMIVSGLIVFGIKNNYRLIWIWLIIMVVLSILGIYDFYNWLYDYGHNLSPDAPIKVPGMTYQPPLFGEKMLLNFKAESYPALGSVFLFLSIVFAMMSIFLQRKKNED